MSDHGPDNQPPHEQSRWPQQHQPDHASDAATDPDMNVDVVYVPQPRSPVDDQSHIPAPPPPSRLPHEPADQSGQRGDGVPADNGLVEPDFRYEQTWKRGKYRRYHGFVERVGGVDGERLREDLAAAIRDLLDWAARHGGANGPDMHRTKSVDDADSGDSKDSDDRGRSS